MRLGRKLTTLLAGIALTLAAAGNLSGTEPDASLHTAQAASGRVEDKTGNDEAVDPAVLRRGRIMFLQCTACHSTKRGEEHKVGPNLHGVVGARAAQKEGFAYTESLRQSGVVWTKENLDRFLEKPNDLVPGTAMVFIGVEKAENRAALIKFLEQETR